MSSKRSVLPPDATMRKSGTLILSAASLIEPDTAIVSSALNATVMRGVAVARPPASTFHQRRESPAEIISVPRSTRAITRA